MSATLEIMYGCVVNTKKIDTDSAELAGLCIQMLPYLNDVRQDDGQYAIIGCMIDSLHPAEVVSVGELSSKYNMGKIISEYDSKVSQLRAKSKIKAVLDPQLARTHVFIAD